MGITHERRIMEKRELQRARPKLQESELKLSSSAVFVTISRKPDDRTSVSSISRPIALGRRFPKSSESIANRNTCSVGWLLLDCCDTIEKMCALSPPKVAANGLPPQWGALDDSRGSLVSSEGVISLFSQARTRFVNGQRTPSRGIRMK